MCPWQEGFSLHTAEKSIRGNILGSSYFLILAGKDELFNTLHVHAVTPIPSKKVELESPEIYEGDQRLPWSFLLAAKMVKQLLILYPSGVLVHLLLAGSCHLKSSGFIGEYQNIKPKKPANSLCKCINLNGHSTV